MPNRILKESICTSEEIDRLSPLEEIFFYRLMVNCDDYGCMDARPRILSSRLFPLKVISEELIILTLDKLCACSLIELYEVNNRPYLHMISWETHQQIRAHKHKYPYMDEYGATKITAEDIGYQTISYDIVSNETWDDINCNQMISNDIKCSPNPIQSESESNPNPEARNDSDDFADDLDAIDEQLRQKQEPKKQPKKKKEQPIDETPVVFQLMLNDGSNFDVHQSLIDELTPLYPNVDIEQEFRNMIGWIKGNPTKRKTRTGVMKFITMWIGREQNRYHGTPIQQPVRTNGHKNPFAEMAFSMGGEAK